jgi:MoaA/NifB/PqqE/SkfB family radical SAM enzyme
MLVIYEGKKMQSLKVSLMKFVLKHVVNWALKDPEIRLMKIMKVIGKVSFTKKVDGGQNRRNLFMNVFTDNDTMMYKWLVRFMKEMDPRVTHRFLQSVGIHAAFVGNKKKWEVVNREKCNVPGAILMDPTSRCNIKCIGCWAAEYEQTDEMDYELLDRIIREGKEIGIHFYLYTGGEPTIRKADLIKLAAKHQDCWFMAFTNGTLLDEKFAKKCAELGNMSFAISAEGYEEETDFRRGKGSYKKMRQGMDNLKKYRVPFGFSCCYHNKNVYTVGSEEYIDFLIDKGAIFGWFFTYVPIGKNARMDLMAEPEQREWMFHQIRHIRRDRKILVVDFWNDGDYVRGCIAGGKNYLHINARGDVEPCAFIHYATHNIRNCTLLEALKSPLFKQYQWNQPFNPNHLRPCPLLDNPEHLENMVISTGAYSTQMLDNEDVRDLCDKCRPMAKKWAETANSLWQTDPKVNNYINIQRIKREMAEKAEKKIQEKKKKVLEHAIH